MKKIYPLVIVYVISVVVILILRIVGLIDAGIYSVIVRWINFGILVYLIVSFGSMPIKNFLAGQKEDLAREIERVETEKVLIRQKILETQNNIKESQSRFLELKNRIVQEGEKKKEQIIADAHQKSRFMLDETQQKIDRMINEAIASVRSEMVDLTIDLVEKRLSEIVTDEDRQKYIDRYLLSISAQ